MKGKSMLFNCGENVYITSVYIEDSNISVGTTEDEYNIKYKNIFNESLERCLYKKTGCFYSNRENICEILKIDNKINNYRDNNKVKLKNYNNGYGINLDNEIIIVTKDNYESDSIYYDTVEEEFVEDSSDNEIINGNDSLVYKNRIVNWFRSKSIYDTIYNNRIFNYIIIFFIIIFGLYMILYLYIL